MRQRLLNAGAKELSYEIREIVKKADQLKKLGLSISWENIGDPIQKHHLLPGWIKDIVSELVKDDDTYSYCPSKGMLETREFLAKQTNELGGAQITADDICFFNGLGDAISKVYQFISRTSRVIGPSPAYSTHSSAEAAHAAHEPLTYKLDPNIDPDLINLARSFKASRAQIFWKIEFPASLPPLFAGLRIGSTLAVVGVVVGELVGGNSGLGFLLSFGEGQGNTPMVFVTIILLTVVGSVAYLLVVLLEQRVLHYLPKRAMGGI